MKVRIFFFFFTFHLNFFQFKFFLTKKIIGVLTLKSYLYSFASKEESMMEDIPIFLSQAETKISQIETARSLAPAISWNEFLSILQHINIKDPKEIEMVKKYLQRIGKIIFYQFDDPSSNFCVINPNWLHYLHTCLLTNLNLAPNGILSIRDFPLIWENQQSIPPLLWKQFTIFYFYFYSYFLFILFLF